MAFDLRKILESKRAYRQRIAVRPIGEKLCLLDQLRERELALRGLTRDQHPSRVREEPESVKPL